MKFYCNIDEDCSIIWSDEMGELWVQHLATYKPTDLVQIEVKKYQLPKTHKQLGAWFGLFASMVLTAFEDRGYDTSYVFKLEKPTGIPISKDVLKDYMSSVCPVYDGETRLTIKSMNIPQMADFFDKCRNFAASQWSIFVPEPDPKYKKTPNG
jgi:hypothetical protein